MYIQSLEKKISGVNQLPVEIETQSFEITDIIDTPTPNSIKKMNSNEPIEEYRKPLEFKVEWNDNN